MHKRIGLASLAILLVVCLAGCGIRAVPTSLPATQTPWIIVITATPVPGTVTQMAPSPTLQMPATSTVGKPSPAAEDSTKTPAPSGAAASVTPARTATASSTKAVPPTATHSPSATRPAATSTLTPQAVPPTPTEASPVPTIAATPTSTSAPTSVAAYPAPVLREPQDDAPFSWGSAVIFEWEPAGSLKSDEYYVVQLEAALEVTGAFWYGDQFYTQDTQLALVDAAIAPFHPPSGSGKALVSWWVRVVRKVGEDENGKPIAEDIGEPSSKRVFVTEPKP